MRASCWCLFVCTQSIFKIRKLLLFILVFLILILALVCGLFLLFFLFLFFLFLLLFFLLFGFLFFFFIFVIIRSLKNMPVNNWPSWIFYHFCPMFLFQLFTTVTKTNFSNRVGSTNAVVIQNRQFQSYFSEHALIHHEDK